MVARGEEGDDLVDCHGYTLRHVEVERLCHESGLLDLGEVGLYSLSVEPHHRAGRDRHLHTRLCGLHFEEHGIVVRELRLDWFEVLAVEHSIPGNSGVDDATVDSRLDMHGSRPILGQERCLKTCRVRVTHVHEASLGDPGAATVWIGQDEHASKHALTEIELLSVVVNLGVPERQPRTVTDAESEV